MRTLIVDPELFAEGGPIRASFAGTALAEAKSPPAVTVLPLEGKLFVVTNYTCDNSGGHAYAAELVPEGLWPGAKYATRDAHFEARQRAPGEVETGGWKGLIVLHGGTRYVLGDGLTLVAHPRKAEAPPPKGKKKGASKADRPEPVAAAAAPAPNGAAAPPLDARLLPIDRIDANPHNPRRDFDPAELEELAASIKEHGLLEPVIVYAVRERFVLIAGERRLRACKLAGLAQAPGIVRPAPTATESLSLMLVENLQRADLNALEEAAAYRQLAELGWKQSQIAQAVGKSQPVIANALRLLELPPEVRGLILEGQLSAAHGRALAKWNDFPPVCAEIAVMAITQGWNSKQVEGIDLGAGQGIAWNLEKKGLIQEIGWKTLFDRAVCRQCPFGAYRSPNNSDHGYCLKPEHYRALQQEELDRRNAATLEKEQAARSHMEKREERLRLDALAGSRAEADAGAKGGEVAAAEAAPPLRRSAPVPELPHVRDFGQGNIERIAAYGDTCPPGCSESCPCRGLATDYDGKIVPICLNPKRFQQLKGQATREKNKQGKRDLRALEAAFLEEVRTLAAGDVRALAWLALENLGSSYVEPLRDVAKALNTPGIEDLFKVNAWNRTGEHFDRAAELGAGTLLRLLVAYHGLHEIDKERQRQSFDPRAVRWFLKAGEAPSGGASPSDRTDPTEPTEGLLRSDPSPAAGAAPAGVFEPPDLSAEAEGAEESPA